MLIKDFIQFFHKILITFYIFNKSFSEKKLYQNDYNQSLCNDCGLYGYCVEKFSTNNSFYSQKYVLKKDYLINNKCLKCICPSQISGKCCKKSTYKNKVLFILLKTI